LHRCIVVYEIKIKFMEKKHKYFNNFKQKRILPNLCYNNDVVICIPALFKYFIFIIRVLINHILLNCSSLLCILYYILKNEWTIIIQMLSYYYLYILFNNTLYLYVETTVLRKWQKLSWYTFSYSSHIFLKIRTSFKGRGTV